MRLSWENGPNEQTCEPSRREGESSKLRQEARYHASTEIASTGMSRIEAGLEMDLQSKVAPPPGSDSRRSLQVFQSIFFALGCLQGFFV
jgi:hypothetical protein